VHDLTGDGGDAHNDEGHLEGGADQLIGELVGHGGADDQGDQSHEENELHLDGKHVCILCKIFYFVVRVSIFIYFFETSLYT